MKFDIDIRPAEVPALLRRLTDVAGAAAWQRREAQFTAQIRGNPMIERYLDTQFAIEQAVFRAKRYRASTGRLPTHKRPDMTSLYGFAGMMSRVLPRLPRPAQDKMKSRICGALNDDVGLSPLAFELRAVEHFMARGFDVEFHDLCNNGGFDFLVRNDTAEIEVECKSASGDLGRKIHLLRQYQLGELIFPSMLAGKAGVVRVIVVDLPDRLHGRREIMANVAAAVERSLATGGDVRDQKSCSVSYFEFPIAATLFDCDAPPRFTEEEVTAYSSRMLGYAVRHVMAACKPRHDATVVAVRSAKPDQFLMGLYRDLKGASEQFSTTRPGIICVQLRNLTSAQLVDVAGAPKQAREPTGIQLMTAKFFDSNARRHVHTVAYTAPGTLMERRYRLGDRKITEITEEAASYRFINQQHALANDRRYHVFS